MIQKKKSVPPHFSKRLCIIGWAWKIVTQTQYWASTKTSKIIKKSQVHDTNSKKNRIISHVLIHNSWRGVVGRDTTKVSVTCFLLFLFYTPDTWEMHSIVSKYFLNTFIYVFKWHKYIKIVQNQVLVSFRVFIYCIIFEKKLLVLLIIWITIQYEF